MKSNWMLLSFLAAALTAACLAQSDPAQQPGNPPGMPMGRGMMGQGVVGTVTDVASDHFAVKTFQGDTYTVQFSANTRFLKQPSPSAGSPGAAQPGGFMRTPPTPIQSSDIKVGDVIMARGQLDSSSRSIGAMAVVQLDKTAAQHMLAMEESFGKTWLAGRITAIDGAKVTLKGGPNRGTYTFVADESTQFLSRRNPITLSDLKVGDPIRVEGSLKDGQFVATSVHRMMVRAMGGPAPRQGPPPQ
ncbi:MAG: DUF5666 domain-containing protein [Acidobacteriota bacterium]